ncbi:raffinose/stachyose/melibiose transport system substrate-binding protein [Caldicoprobacter guelmensis]|uniref:ABC transporter substrate-binding protein n=1 Tax=Caldicoprobacter guelmensis TaxID=1170224 RepID=UPI00195BE407|nr:extracellular solute-binding protein [Caldicoprobacter guelmensis]MBM7583432.1 raffinose/stachyose/melibiose transport system substrate-binding protein [Caldicoprobacter guelmensis]
MRKRKGIKLVSMLLLVVFCIAVISGCAKSKPIEQKPEQTTENKETNKQEKTEDKKEQKEITIRYMSATTAGSPQYDILHGLIEKFQKEHPNIKIVHDALPSAELRTKITVEMAADNPPHASWCPLSYAREFMKDNKIIDWRPVFEDPKHKEFKQWFDQKTFEAVTYKDGRIMMAPYEASVDALFYNSELFEKYGWEPPKTFDDLIELAKKCREKGIYALVTGGKDIRFAWLASALLVRVIGVEKAKALGYGNAMTKWNDPEYGFPQAMKKFKELVDAEAFPPGVLGMTVNEADQMFARGEAAMYYEGQWKVGNFIAVGGDEFIKKVKRVNFPIMTDMPNGDPEACVGGILVGTIVSSNKPQEEIEAAIEWAKAISSPEYYGPAMETGTNLYAGKINYDRTKPPAVINELYDAFQKTPRFIPSMDAMAPPPIDLAIKKTAMPGIVSGELTVEEAIAEVQKVAEEYVKSLK